MSLYLNIGGTWKDLKQAHSKVSGTWQNLRECHTKVGGVWKRVWPTVALVDPTSINSTQNSGVSIDSRAAIFFNWGGPFPDPDDWLDVGNWGTVHSVSPALPLVNDVASYPWLQPYLNYNLYEARATVITQTGGSLTGTFGTWQALTSFREWGIDQHLSGVATLSFTLEIRDATYLHNIHSMTLNCTARVI